MSPPGHSEIEIGLGKLYRFTGNEKYLELAKFFLDVRGKSLGGRKLYGDKRQDHKPVLEQDEAVGHAVRAGYMYCGMADVAAMTGDNSYVEAIDRIWENVVSKKMSLTGGVGPKHKGEAYGENYELPNKTAYNETCAAIALVMWNHRMFLLHGEGKYIDVLERTLYNGLISGVSLDGDKFFYCNPLESDGKWKFNKGWASRFPWSRSMCCPTNMVRFLPSLPGYIYASKKNDIYVNLFVEGSGKIKTDDNVVTLSQETDYPWEGKVRITVKPSKEQEFTIKVRLPGWACGKPVPSDLYRYALQLSPNISLTVNGEKINLRSDRMPKDGYAKIKRVWKTGDVIELDLAMEVRRVVCNEKVAENRGKVALERGPIVYCAEGFDNDGKVSDITVGNDEEFEVVYQKNALYLITPGHIVGRAGWQSGWKGKKF
jgi:DUF1680 family protein